MKGRKGRHEGKQFYKLTVQCETHFGQLMGASEDLHMVLQVILDAVVVPLVSVHVVEQTAGVT